MKWWAVAMSTFLKVKLCTMALKMPQNALSSSQVVISQPMPFKGHLKTRECLIRLRNKPQQKLTSELLAVMH